MKERVVSLGILVFALVYLSGSIALKVGTLSDPGPGFVPAAIAAALLIAAAINAYQTFSSASKEEGEAWLTMAPIGMALALIAYPLMLRPLSYIIT
nr:tripartite tricarboxylate transporter TctB family protein [Desulfitobacterium hafniense]